MACARTHRPATAASPSQRPAILLAGRFGKRRHDPPERCRRTPPAPQFQTRLDGTRWAIRLLPGALLETREAAQNAVHRRRGGNAFFETEDFREGCAARQNIRRPDSAPPDKERRDQGIDRIGHGIMAMETAGGEMIADQTPRAERAQDLFHEHRAALRSGVEILIKIGLDAAGSADVTSFHHRNPS